MIRPLYCAPWLSLLLTAGSAVSLPMLVVGAARGDDIIPMQMIAERCTKIGQGYVSMGGGMCGRVTGHVRVDMGARNAALNSWASNGTSNAALRTEGPSMVPGVATTQHLRVHGPLESYSPIR